MKALYLYSGKRKEVFKGKINYDYPDTQFYGLNHLKKFGIDAEYKEIGDLIKNKAILKIFGFRIRHLLTFFLTNGYDVVFGASILFMMIFKKVFRVKRKFVMLDIGMKIILPNNKKSIKFRIINSLIKELDGLICLSNMQKDFAIINFPFLKNKIYFIPLGVDIEYYKPIFLGRKNFILSAGRDNGRDYKTVIEAAKKMPNENFQIVCSKRNLVGVDNIPKNVKIFFDIPTTELNKKYKEAKMLLLITHSDEFFDASDCSGQTVLLDAMAIGLPIIASKKKYLPDYAKDKTDVLTVDFYNSDEIVKKVSFLSKNDKYRSQLAKNARETIEKNFSTEMMGYRISKIFKKIKP